MQGGVDTGEGIGGEPLRPVAADWTGSVCSAVHVPAQRLAVVHAFMGVEYGPVSGAVRPAVITADLRKCLLTMGRGVDVVAAHRRS